MRSVKSFWLPHLPALVAPLLIGAVLVYLYRDTVPILEDQGALRTYLLGVFPGMSFGYLVCAWKWSQYEKGAAGAEEPPA